jgi:hypothetical protein
MARRMICHASCIYRNDLWVSSRVLTSFPVFISTRACMCVCASARVQIIKLDADRCFFETRETRYSHLWTSQATLVTE